MAFFRKRSEERKKIAHILAGAIILVHGTKKWIRAKAVTGCFICQESFLLLWRFFINSLCEKLSGGWTFLPDRSRCVFYYRL